MTFYNTRHPPPGQTGQEKQEWGLPFTRKVIKKTLQVRFKVHFSGEEGRKEHQLEHLLVPKQGHKKRKSVIQNDCKNCTIIFSHTTCATLPNTHLHLLSFFLFFFNK